MSVILDTEDGWIISHLQYLKKIYNNVNDSGKFCELVFDETFFNINSQFLRDDQFYKSENGVLNESQKWKKRKKFEKSSSEDSSQMDYVEEAFLRIQNAATGKGIFGTNKNFDNNKEARDFSNKFYSKRSAIELNQFHGANQADTPIVTELQNTKFIFPQRCNFYAYDVKEISQKLEKGHYDFILLDPPWWNKFVRRKKQKFSKAGYNMMYNEDFAKIPIKDLLGTDGIVAVWCTNSPSHLQSILNEMFPSWGVHSIGTWYWVKVTQTGHTVCNFTLGTGKQPYEILIFGQKSSESEVRIPDKKLIVSVPSCIHSHKPPIDELIKPYIKSNAECLEIFARYLLPGWTSWGLEVLKFQDLSLYKNMTNEDSSVESKLLVSTHQKPEIELFSEI